LIVSYEFFIHIILSILDDQSFLYIFNFSNWYKNYLILILILVYSFNFRTIKLLYHNLFLYLKESDLLFWQLLIYQWK